jgi:small subunit ribosomal protein S2
MGAKIVAVIDTDSDPDDIDLPIPANDDSIRSIRLLLGYLTDAVFAGKSQLPQETKEISREEPKAIPSLS